MYSTHFIPASFQLTITLLLAIAPVVRFFNPSFRAYKRIDLFTVYIRDHPTLASGT